MRETPLSKLGESRVLRAFMPIINAHNERVAATARQAGHIEPLDVGPGDDCAVLAAPAPGQRTRTLPTLPPWVHARRASSSP